MACSAPVPVSVRRIVVLLIASALSGVAGCDDDAEARAARGDHRGDTAGDSALPAPEGAIGSVTGMPEGPGPGTSPITPVRSAAMQDTAGDTATSASYADLDSVAAASSGDGGPPRPEPEFRDALEDPLADAPPIIIVPDIPDTPIPPRPVEGPQRPPPEGRLTGTERATESTTIIVEPGHATGD